MSPEDFTHPSLLSHNGSVWFHERSDTFPGQAFGLEVKQVLHHEKSAFQDILVFELVLFGNVLVLNGIIQCTEKDEFAYQEVITHVAVMSHEAPRRVLVIGGGDCGVVRELVKHLEKGVESITLVEIDRLVIDLSIKYLPNMAKFHNHPKVNIVIDDGFKYLSNLGSTANEDKFDVIITDSSDPEGPAEEFFQENYFRLLQLAVKPHGVVIMQSSENIWLNINYLALLVDKARGVFPTVGYCQCYMPSYTSGQLGLIVCSNDADKKLHEPLRTFEEEDMFEYYSAAVHRAAFVLPAWANRIINKQS